MELVLPRNCVEIEQEEMVYLDGGYRASKQVWMPAAEVGMTYDDYMDQSMYKSLVVGAMIALLPRGASLTTGALATIAMHYYDREKAKKYDLADGILDYQLIVTIPGRYVTIYNPYPPHSWEGARW